MMIFLENAAGMQILLTEPALRRRWMVKIALANMAKFAEALRASPGPVFFVAPEAQRWVKFFAGIAQLPIFQQAPTALAFRFNFWKYLISDGLMTEYAVSRLGLRARRFYSILDARIRAPIINETCIVGSHWAEFGSMSEAHYRRHLEYLGKQYPSGIYYCHPREYSRAPEEVFGPERVRRLNEPIEHHCSQRGVPRTLVAVCSSSLLSLARLADCRAEVELVVVAPQWFDGHKGDIVEQFRKPFGGVSRIVIADIQQFIVEKLRDWGVAVTVNRQPDP